MRVPPGSITTTTPSTLGESAIASEMIAGGESMMMISDISFSSERIISIRSEASSSAGFGGKSPLVIAINGGVPHSTNTLVSSFGSRNRFVKPLWFGIAR